MTRRRRSVLAGGLIAIVVTLISVSLADEWAYPEPVSFHSRGFSYVAEIFPPKSRQNPTDKPLCYVYEMAYPGVGWDAKSTLKWKANLANGTMPYEAVLSMNGDLVTLNDYGKLGYENAVVIYNHDGRLVRSYSFDDLGLAAEIARIDQSTSSRWWNKTARYYFVAQDFYVVLSWGKVLKFSLGDGAMSSGVAKDFAELSQATRNAYANEEVGVWRTSLRFASITDVKAAGGAAH